jgi:hypothetical protein
MPFADLLQWVSQSRKTGTLAVEGEPYNKKVYFREGTVVAASSEDPKEFLSYYLVGWGFLGEEELQELLDMQERHGTLLGELLVIVGRVNREELANILQVKTEEAIYELFLRDEGDFRFLENILPAKKFQPLGLAVDMLSLEGVRRRDEWLRIREAIPDPEYIPKLVRAVDVQQMGAVELGILREINGVNTIEDIALACRIALFHVLHFVFQGVEQGLFMLIGRADDQDKAIPGFTHGSWRILLKDIDKNLADGDLLAAHHKIGELRAKHAAVAEAQQMATDYDQKIAARLVQAHLTDEVVPELAVPLAQLTSIDCSPQEGFLLSRINGTYSLLEILKMVPGSDLENRLMISALISRKVVRLKGQPQSSPASTTDLFRAG